MSIHFFKIIPCTVADIFTREVVSKNRILALWKHLGTLFKQNRVLQMYLKLKNTKWIQKIATSNNLPTVPCPWILTHYCQLFFKLPFIIVIHSNICHKLQSNIFITNGHPKVPELCFLKARHHCLQRLCLINIFVFINKDEFLYEIRFAFIKR